MTAAELFDNYCAWCRERDVIPATFALWALLTDSLLPLRPEREKGRAPADPEKNPAKALANARAKADRLSQIGDLTKDGRVRAVRTQTNGRVRKHILTARTCKTCKQYLPASSFSKHKNGIRAHCRKCDNARRRPKLT
jgi:hypothetical protein